MKLQVNSEFLRLPSSWLVSMLCNYLVLKPATAVSNRTSISQVVCSLIVTSDYLLVPQKSTCIFLDLDNVV